jgi:adenosine deaminase
LIVGLDAGFARAEQDGLPQVGLCISLLRTQSGDEAIELVELLGQLRHPRVVALSIDGNEAAAGRTGPRFAAAFARAGEIGLRRTVHAGESSGPEGVWDAIELSRPIASTMAFARSRIRGSSNSWPHGAFRSTSARPRT